MEPIGGIMPTRLPALLLGLSLLTIACATMASGRGSTTAEERQRVVAIAHKLEASPLDQTLFPERDWAKQWVIENPDVRIRICTQLLAGLRRPRYQFRLELTDQMMLSSAAFLIEHPEQARDNLAEEVAGMQSVLKAYSAILKSNPDAHSKSLDDLEQKRDQGKLTDSVREAIKDCH
jgi:hypothetical protein